MDELEPRLQALEAPPSPAPPVDELRQRVRRRRARRRTVSFSVAAVAVVGLVSGAVLAWPGGSQRVAIDEQQTPAPSAGGAYVPPTSQEGDQTVVPVAFPDGSTGELVYPSHLGLVDEGVTPRLRVRLASSEAATRADRSLEFHPGPPEEVVTELNDGKRPEPVATYGDGVALWDMDDAQVDRDYLALPAGDWTVLVPDRIRARGDTRELTDAERERYATHMEGREGAGGLPVLEFTAPVEPAGPAQLLLGHPALARKELRYQPGPAVNVAANGCTPDEEDDAQKGWCQADAQVAFTAWGDEAFVDEVRAGLAIREVSFAPGIIDDTWASADERAAWEQAHGEATWVPGLFYPPEADLYGSNTDPDDLVVRWHRIADEPLDFDDTDRTRRAFEALQGPPPPGLATALRSVPMQVRATTSDDGVVTIDFDDAIVRPTSLGSSAGIATATQIKAQVRHLYPDAHTLCILIDGNGSLDEPGPFLFHEAEGCPMPLTSNSPYAHEPHNGT